jgi:hypothetical protein
MPPAPLTTAAFAAYRAGRQTQAINIQVKRTQGDSDQMTVTDGLDDWHDGVASGPMPKGPAPIIPANPPNCRLWVVMPSDVLHAPEHCAFGAARSAGAVKHSNLTGGQAAYAGGELVFVDPQTVVLNGCSGRYRVRDEAEMKALAGAFKASGYKIWSMGYDSDTNRPFQFGAADPVAA